MVLGGPVMSLISYTGFLFVPLGHGSVIQPSCATLGGLLLAALFLKEKISVSRLAGAIVIVGGLGVIGAESIGHIGADGVQGDLIFVLTGLMFAGFGALLRHWRVSAFSAATVINVLSLLLLPLYLLTGGLSRITAIGVSRERDPGAGAGRARRTRRALSVRRPGAAPRRRPRRGVSRLRAGTDAAHRVAAARRAADGVADGGIGDGAVRVLSGAAAAQLSAGWVTLTPTRPCTSGLLHRTPDFKFIAPMPSILQAMLLAVAGVLEADVADLGAALDDR